MKRVGQHSIDYNDVYQIHTIVLDVIVFSSCVRLSRNCSVNQGFIYCQCPTTVVSCEGLTSTDWDLSPFLSC